MPNIRLVCVALPYQSLITGIAGYKDGVAYGHIKLQQQDEDGTWVDVPMIFTRTDNDKF